MLLSSSYLPPVHYFAKLFAADGEEVQVEQWDHYMKQTYRNRCLIGSGDGVLALTVPTEKADGPKCLMKDVRISDHGDWRRVHWNALTAAYAGTPFFLYYEDVFRPFYEQRFPFLFDFNLRLVELCCRLIDIHPRLVPTTDYRPCEPCAADDYRERIHPKHPYTDDPTFRPAPYWQVFADRWGFRSNLSIVDLLFNMGPESLFVLQQCQKNENHR